MIGDFLIFEEIINICSWIGARDNTWQLLSSNISSHISTHVSSTLNLGVGGNWWGNWIYSLQFIVGECDSQSVEQMESPTINRLHRHIVGNSRSISFWDRVNQDNWYIRIINRRSADVPYIPIYNRYVKITDIQSVYQKSSTQKAHNVHIPWSSESFNCLSHDHMCRNKQDPCV